jgi:xylulokinase
VETAVRNPRKRRGRVAEPLLLGVDVGTGSTKCVLIDVRGRLHAASQADYPLHHSGSAWVEQDAGDWWRAVCKTVREALAQAPHGPERVLGVGVSSQAPTLLPLDAAGRPLRRPIIWMDRRAEAEAADLNARLGADEIHRVTGNRPDAFYLAARLLWFRKKEPELFRRAAQFVQCNGYINFKLTGNLGLDRAHAALLQLREYGTEKWYAAMCEVCGVEPTQFPASRDGHSVEGTVTKEAAAATGLRAGTPVVAGTVDSAAAALEAGLSEPGAAVEMTGTSTVVVIPNNQGLTEPALISMPHALPGIHLLLGAMVSSGGSLRWFRDQLGQTELQDARVKGTDAFDLLTRQAAREEPGGAGVIFLPYMMGERSPLWHANARGVFFGLSLTTTKGALVRAILEGTAFALRHNVDVARQAGAEIRELRTVGGCSRSAVWNRIKADVLGLPVLQPRSSLGSPFGAAFLAGMATGVYPDAGAALRTIVRIERRFEPSAANYRRYSERYLLFRRLYEHLNNDFNDLAALGGAGPPGRSDERGRPRRGK